MSERRIVRIVLTLPLQPLPKKFTDRYGVFSG